MLIWGITNGSAGMVSQVSGVGELLAAKTNSQFVLKTFKRKAPWGVLPGYVIFRVLAQLTADSDDANPPWPDVILSSGRRAAPFAIAIKKLADKRCTIVHLQDPRIAPSFFDLVVAQEHDHLHGTNVISTFTALHSVTEKKLKAAAEQFAHLGTMLSPRATVLIGGATHNYTPNDAAMQQLIAQLESALRVGGSLMMTASRRTLPQHLEMLKTWAAGKGARVYLYDGESENPYLGLLAHADFILATDDSVNMMSEALATGKPLYILPWQGHKRTKPANFAEKLIEKSVARKFEGALVPFSITPIDEKKEVVNAIIRTLAAKT